MVGHFAEIEHVWQPGDGPTAVEMKITLGIICKFDSKMSGNIPGLRMG